MHTGTLNKASDFEVEIAGQSTDLDGLFPDYTPIDRFGIVVNELLGAVGASLLIDAATVKFFDILPERRNENPTYPELYVFHIGGVKGDFSAYDFWPVRKEVFIPAGDPVALLGEINNRAITRLALPEVEPRDIEILASGLSTWAEQQAARWRLKSSFVYSPSGKVADADVVLSSEEDSIEFNPELLIWPEPKLEDLEAHLDDPSYYAGYTIPKDNVGYIAHTMARFDEVPRAHREEMLARRRALRAEAGGKSIESLRRIDTEEALGLIAAF
jgi:hypothetical protein